MAQSSGSQGGSPQNGQSKQQSSKAGDQEHEHVQPVTEATAAEDASAVREVSQNQVDQVAMVSRTSTGEPHQSPGFEVVGLPEKPTEEHRAAAENRPLKSKSKD